MHLQRGVAQHAALVALLALADWERTPDAEKVGKTRAATVWWALHHDSHEAYLGDITTPVKNAIGRDVVDAIAQRLDVAIAAALEIDRTMVLDACVQRSDAAAYHMEDLVFRPRSDTSPLPDAAKWLKPLPRREARTLFLCCHRAAVEKGIRWLADGFTTFLPGGLKAICPDFDWVDWRRAL